MTSHELAKKLLEGEDLPLMLWIDDGSDISTELRSIPVMMYRLNGEDETIFEHELGYWKDKGTVEPVLEFQVC